MYHSESFIWKRLCETLKPEYKHLFDAHILAHPAFYAEFERKALGKISEGDVKLGARKLAQDIRWDHHEKFSDPVIAYYARMFISKNPRYRSVFRIKGVSRKEIEKICIPSWRA